MYSIRRWILEWSVSFAYILYTVTLQEHGKLYWFYKTRRMLYDLQKVKNFCQCKSHAIKKKMLRICKQTLTLHIKAEFMIFALKLKWRSPLVDVLLKLFFHIRGHLGMGCFLRMLCSIAMFKSWFFLRRRIRGLRWWFSAREISKFT